MSEITNTSEKSGTTEESVSTETAETTVKSVLTGLTEMALSRSESGFDRLDTKSRNLVRKALKARFDRLMGEGPGSFPAAQSVWSVLGTLSGSTRSTDKPEIDLKSETVRFVRILRFAADELVAGNVGFDGFDAIALDETDFADLPDLSDEEVEMARKIANRKIARKSPENDIAAAIRTAFANVPVGTYMKVSDIRRNMDKSFKSDSSWDGRISARLFPKSGTCTVDGIDPVSTGPDGRKGARKVESDIWDSADENDNSDD